jgi:hypothetical protein
MRYAYAGVLQIHVGLEDTANTTGVVRAFIFLRVVLPLIAPALISCRLFGVAAASSGRPWHRAHCGDVVGPVAERYFLSVRPRGSADSGAMHDGLSKTVPPLSRGRTENVFRPALTISLEVNGRG